MSDFWKGFFSKLFDALFNSIKTSHDDSAKVNLDFRNYKILQTASAEIGVKEVSGPKNNPRVVKYHAYSTLDNHSGMDDSVPWCSSFVCFVMEATRLASGKTIGSVNSKLARSWLKWGVSSKSDPWPGDVVVYWRGKPDGWQGHVGIFLKEANGRIYTLGGNQSDAVNVASYSRLKMLDIRRSSKHRKISAAERKALFDFSDQILRDNGFSTGGKVT